MNPEGVSEAKLTIPPLFDFSIVNFGKEILTAKSTGRKLHLFDYGLYQDDEMLVMCVRIESLWPVIPVFPSYILADIPFSYSA